MSCEFCGAPSPPGRQHGCYEGCPYWTLSVRGDPGPLLHALYWDGMERLLRDPGAIAAAAELERARLRERRL